MVFEARVLWEAPWKMKMILVGFVQNLLRMVSLNWSILTKLKQKKLVKCIGSDWATWALQEDLVTQTLGLICNRDIF